MDDIVVKNLVKNFPIKGGVVRAVKGVSFSIKKGEIFGLLGVNGAGKSTIINILSGLTLPDEGKVNIFGKDFFENEEEIKSSFNLATAYYCLSGHLTVLQNFKVYAKLYNLKNPEEKIKELSQRFMITSLFPVKVHSLSSGEKTRVVLVKALLNDPKLLFLDECTVGLDPDMAEVARDYLKRYNKETGCTMLFTSHYMQEVERLCDRIAFMDKGKIVKVGTAKELLKELQWQVIKLHFKNNLEQAKEIIKREHLEYQEEPDGFISFKIKNQNKTIYPLLEKFIKAKIPFEDMHLEKPTLEEYFIQRSRK